MSRPTLKAQGARGGRTGRLPSPRACPVEGGVITPNWHDSEGRGPDYCQKLLEEQGVTFVDGHADPATRVTWDVLRERDEMEPVPQ